MKMHLSVYWRLLALALLCVLSVGAKADTNVSGTIAADTTWTAANSPYIVTDHVTVDGGVTLTVESGVTVRFNDNLGLYVNGRINASGATFTRNGANYWRGIYLGTGAQFSSLTNCTISYAGSTAGIGYYHYYTPTAALYLDGPGMTISGCTISNSQTHGIELYDANPTIQNTAFNNMGEGYYAIVFDTINISPVMSGCSFSGTGYAGIAIPGSSTGQNLRWYKPGATLNTYYLNGDLSVNHTLTIDPGVTVKSAGQRLLVWGTLNADGTAAQPITFTSRNATPAPGDWKGIVFGPGAGASVMDYCTVSYAGNVGGIGYYHYYTPLTAVYVDSCAPQFTNCTFSNSQTHGVELYNSNATFTGVTFTGNRYSAMWLRDSSRPTITTAAFTSNGADGYYTVSTDANSVPTVSGTTFSGNAKQGIENRGGALAANATWQRWAANAPHAVTGSVTVNGEVTLTVEPGAVLKFWNTGLYVYGVLNATGTTSRITFTSLKDDPAGGDTNGDGNTLPAAGNWIGLYLSPASSASVLTRCDFRYGGAYRDNNGIGYFHYYYPKAFVYIDTCSPAVTNCTFAKSETHGIEVYSSQATVQNCSFVNMGAGYYAIACDTTDTFLVTGGNAASGTGFPGIAIAGGGYNTGRWTKPGANFPYFLTGHIDVNGGQTLTIDPGVTVKSAGVRVQVWGTLTADGTQTEPITFTSRNAAPAAGDWWGIVFGPGAGASVLDYCTVSYAGALRDGNGIGYYHYYYALTAVYVDSCSPQFSNCTFANSQTHGIELYGSNATFTNAAFTGNRYTAMWLRDGSRPTITTAAYTNNGAEGYYTISQDASSVGIPTGTTFSGNTKQGVEMRGGTLSAPATWKRWAANAPYAITGSTTVTTNLTIEPGVTLKLAAVGLYFTGKLTATGVPDRITVTSLKDDAVIGDTNGDAAATTPAAGDWYGIYLSNGQTQISHCDFRYGGANNNAFGYWHYYYPKGILYIDSCSPSITNSTLADSQCHGITLYESAAVLRDNAITNVGADWYAISRDTINCFPVMSGNSASGTGNLGVAVWAGNISTGRWYKPGANFPYFLNGELNVNGGETLTIDHGVTVKTVGQRIQVSGTLLANGTCADPVVFTSRNATPAPGDWLGIYFGGGAGNSRLRFAQVLYAGSENSGYGLGYYYWGYRKTAIFVEDSSPQFHNVVIARSQRHGIEMRNSNAVLADSLIANSGWSGVVLWGGGAPQILNNTIVEQNVEGQCGIYMDNVSPTLGNNIIAHNAYGAYKLNANGAPVLKSNLFFSNTTDYTNLTAGTNDFNANPRFVDRAAGNYRLQAISICINQGDNALVGTGWKDLDGRPRRVDARVDRGAYEYGTATYYQPDLQMMNAEYDTDYVGDGLYTTAEQTRTEQETVDPGVVTTYFIKLENDGMAADSFLVTGTSSSPEWEVRIYDVATGLEVGDQISDGGWTTPVLGPGESFELRLEVAPLPLVLNAWTEEVTMTVQSNTEPAKTDAIKAVLNILPGTVTPTAKTYTTDADFALGSLVGVQYATVANQLQLAANVGTYPFIWVPNSNEGTVSKVDVVTGKEVGRYRTGPTGNGSPSRTTVDLYGNCFVANRVTGTVVKIGLYENDQYVDRNNNGRIETSQDLNNDGDITGAELLPWGQDECVLYEVVVIAGQEATFTPGQNPGYYANSNSNPGPRGIAVDADNNVWIGTYDTRKLYHINGATGAIQKTIDTAPYNCMSYGALIDSHGMLWSASITSNMVLRLNPADDSITTVDVGHTVYGLGLDKHDHLFVAGWQSTKLSRINVVTATKDWTVDGRWESRGIAVTDDENVWVANTGPGTVTRWTNDGTVIADITGFNGPTGVSVDGNGKVWVVDLNDEYIHRIDPATNTKDLSKRIIGTNHYGYSDMTGILARATTTKIGTWTVIHDAGCYNTPWGKLIWHRTIPQGTSFVIQVRSSNNRRVWSDWETVETSNAPMIATPPGRYLQVQVKFQVESGTQSPILYDLTVSPATATFQPDLAVRNAAENTSAGVGVYNADGEGQARAQSPLGGQAAVYHVTLVNGGTIPDRIKLTGPAGGNGWTVNYRNAATNADLTAQITGVGYTTEYLAAGASRVIRVEVTPDLTVASGAVKEVLLTATSVRSTGKFDAVKMTTTRKPLTSVSLVANPASPGAVNALVYLTAAGDGGKGVAYRFFYSFNGAAYVQIRKYYQTPTVFFTPTQAGNYSFMVWAREEGHTNTKDCYTIIPFTVVTGLTAASPMTVTADPPSPKMAGTPITLTANAAGGAHPEYRFFIGYNGGAVTQVQAYGVGNTYLWTPAQAGSYTILVYAREAGRNVTKDVHKTLTYTVTPPPISGVGLAANPAGQQTAGQQFTLTATPVNGINVEYRFFKVYNGVTTTIQNYGGSNTCPVTLNEAGSYSFIVWAREVGSATKVSATLPYTITAP